MRQRASLSLLLAKAYEQFGDLPQAARTFQEVYFAFPASSQAKEAEVALGSLHRRWVPIFPNPVRKSKPPA